MSGDSRCRPRFSRPEVIRLAKVTSNQLQHLERIGALVPDREWVENKKKPDCYYSLQQLVALCIMQDLANKTSAQEVRVLTGFVLDYVNHPESKQKQLVFLGRKPRLLCLDWSDFRVSETGSYRLVVAKTVSDVLHELGQKEQE